MNETLSAIVAKFGLDINRKSPIEILKINRTIMAQTLCELNFVEGAEIGVAKGEHAEILCQNNPNLHLYAIDAWEGYRGYRDYLDDRLKSFHREAVDKLKPYNVTILRKFSMDAVVDFEDNSLDFAYIDGGHDFLNVTMDICHWIKKVKVGGILYGHDFKRSNNPRLCQEVVDVVQAYTYAKGINPWFTLGERGRNDGMYREGTRSWMWVKA